jgi:pimeloyl-ACP methyl ester carboxylesterase
MSRSTRSRSALALATAAVLALSACSGDGDPAADETTNPAPSTSSTPAPVPSGLDRFYDQKLSWSGCGGEFQCAKLTVPTDYAKPAGSTITLSLLRLRTEGDDRLGSLVINPGGPGGSGVDYARSARAVISDAVRDRYDVVGFDPRGVGTSTPLKCLSDAETDQLVAADPTPDDPAEVRSTISLFEQLAARCKAGGGELLAHVTTRDAARDMDVLRAALGDSKLTYLGKSYGTFLGATYAELFPGNVGNVVLDGALDPALPSEQVNLGQAKGFEQATRAFVADCAKSSECPLGSDVDAGMQQLRDFLSQLDADPLPTGDADRPLTEGLGALGIAVVMYDENGWPVLREALSQAFAGEGAEMLRLADIYTGRTQQGTYSSNQNTVIYAVNCTDRSDPSGGLEEVERTVDEFEKVAPTWGPFLAWSQLPCDYWPVEGEGAPAPIRAEGSGPIVVVGTTGDPATPYEWSVNLSKELADGHLITYEGEGHTAYLRGSRCVDKAVDAYLLRGEVPEEGLRCT